MALLARGLLLTLCLVAFTACKQGLNERCEIDSDCEDGLTCSESKKVCTGSGENTDAGFTDAAFGDARPIDGPQPDGDPGAPDADTTDADTTDADTTDADPPDAT